MWDLSSPTRGQTCISCISRQILNHWTTRRVPIFYWSIVDLQYCVRFMFTAKWFSYVCVCTYIYIYILFFRLFSFIVVVQSLNHVWLSVTPWIAAHQASQSFTISLSLLKLASIESVMPSNHLILCHPLLLNFSQHQGLFQWIGFLYQVARVLELQVQHQSFQWVFRVDFL